MNLDNKSVNDTLTAELGRYKEQVKVLKDGKNVEIRSQDKFSDTHEQNAKIDLLKHTLSEQLREKESLIKTVSVLKDDFKKEESRNIDREIALEKKIQHLDNIVYKRDQSAKTVHMLTKPKFFYDRSTKQAIETLMLAEESHSKMLLKQQDLIVVEKKVNTKPIDYVALNKISQDFDKLFVPQTELSAKRAFWSKNSMNSSNPSPSCTPSKVEVLKKLPKVSLVNTSLKKLKYHLADFDNVVKERTTATSITEGTWGSVTRERYGHMKLKERIKSLSGNMNVDKVKIDMDEIETLNIELDHRVSKLVAKNEHLKQTYKQLYDSIKPARIRSKEQCDGLINQVNQKCMKISDLNAKLQEQGLIVTDLKNDLRKLKGKALVNDVVTKHTIEPEMLKIDVEPITPKLLNKKTAHSAYIKHTQEKAIVLRDLVEHELLTNISKTCPSINNTCDKLVAVTTKNKDKRVRLTEPVTSSRNTNTKTDLSSNLVSNKPVLSSTGVRPATSASGSQPLVNTKKDKIQQPPRSNLKNKVEAHPRKVKSGLNNKNCVVELKGTASVHLSKPNTNSDLICVKYNGCMLFDNHDLCVNARVKSKSAKKISKRKCPLTRITTTTKVPPRKSIALETEAPKPVVTLVYSRKPRKSRMHGPVSKPKIVKSLTANNKEPIKFGNDHVAKIMGYGDYHIGNIMISRVYYVDGLGHNLFSVGQFCDSNLEVAFRQHTCFIHNLEGVDLLTGSLGNNLYTLSLGDMMVSSLIFLLSKASKTKSWLWHRRLSHLNFGAINHLARHGLVRGLPKLKFEKDHLCSACAMGKSKKKSHEPKSEDTNQEKLYLLHMDLYGPMRVASVNGKKYILVIVDDYSRFTWVKCLRSKDEAPDFIIKFLKMIQLRLKAPV
ncbi:retrovirus-related pol polyprotein from transposon TNT 1-94 [Tanacetum coccineum]